MKFIRYIIAVLILFVGTNVANTIGLNHDYLTFFVLLLSIIVIFNSRSYKFRKTEVILILFITFYTIYKSIFDGSEGSRMLGFISLITPIVLLSFPLSTVIRLRKGSKTLFLNNEKFFSALFLILISFYITECSIAIMERVFKTNIFIYVDENYSSGFTSSIEGFRSISIHGHPLQNALIVSTIMSFLLISNLKPFFKYGLWFLGYLAILCFNTRSSIVGSAIIIIFYALMNIASKNVSFSKKLITITFVTISVFVGIFLILSTQLGDRLINNGLDDSSSQVRIDIWKVFNNYDVNSLLFGMDFNSLEKLLIMNDLSATENFWIDWTIRYGLMFLIPLILLYYFLFKKMLRSYYLKDKILILTSFILIASTNNSLSSSAVPLIVFIFCCLIFTFKVSFYTHKSNKQLMDNFNNLQSYGTLQT